jgi:hypothetical protein
MFLSSSQKSTFLFKFYQESKVAGRLTIKQPSEYSPFVAELC